MKYIESFLVSFCIFFSIFFLSTGYTKKISVENPSTKILKRKYKFKKLPCIELSNSIEKYSKIYDIPKNIAYGVAYQETRYKGIFHWEYDHKKTSSAGALGPMQVMYSTAKYMFPQENFTQEYLKNNIDLNVKCSMKLLQYLYLKYKDWKIVLGAYNTGKPCINNYAIQVLNYKI